MSRLREWIRGQVDARDVVGAVGLVMLTYGGEAIHAGAGFAIAGGVLVAIAVWVR